MATLFLLSHCSLESEGSGDSTRAASDSCIFWVFSLAIPKNNCIFAGQTNAFRTAISYDDQL